MSDLPPLLAYVHIPKTGGNSVRAVLKSVHGTGFRDWFLADSATQPGDVLPSIPIECAGQLDVPAVRSVAFNTGTGLHDVIHREVRYMTVFRAPMARISSYWRYGWMMRDKKPRWSVYERYGRSVSQLLNEEADPGLANDQVRRVSGARSYRVGERELAAAIRLLESRFDFYTTTERLPMDIPAFFAASWEDGWTVPRFNRSSECPYMPDDSEFEVLEIANSLDLALYHWVLGRVSAMSAPAPAIT